ncbi:hypothetical protein [Streptomyces sp. NPDC006551]
MSDPQVVDPHPARLASHSTVISSSPHRFSNSSMPRLVKYTE